MIRRALRKKMLMRQKLNVGRRKVILLEDGENPWLFLFHGRFLSKVTYGLSERFAFLKCIFYYSTAACCVKAGQQFCFVDF